MSAVSVVIPTYNRAALLPAAIDSALAAIEPGDEVIVVDDGSTDDTPDVLARYGERIRAVRVPNGGAGAARNRGIAEARSPLVAFLDSDDTWFPDKLALQRRLLDARPEVGFVFSDFALREPSGAERRRYLVTWHRSALSWDERLGPGVPYSSIAPLPPGREDFAVHIGDMYLPLLEAGFVSTITVMARRDAPGLRFEEGTPTLEDWFCFARLAREAPAAYLDCETAWNYGHAGPRLTTSVAVYDYLSLRIQVVERVWGRDAAFLARHAERVRATLAALYHQRARWLLSRGRMAEARDDLRRAGGGAALDRALSVLPGVAARGLGDARRLLLGLRRRGGPRDW